MVVVVVVVHNHEISSRAEPLEWLKRLQGPTDRPTVGFFFALLFLEAKGKGERTAWDMGVLERGEGKEREKKDRVEIVSN